MRWRGAAITVGLLLGRVGQQLARVDAEDTAMLPVGWLVFRLWAVCFTLEKLFGPGTAITRLSQGKVGLGWWRSTAPSAESVACRRA